MNTVNSAMDRDPEHLLYLIAEATSAQTGEEFFRALMRCLAAALNVRCSFITECLQQPPAAVRTLAFWDRGRFQDNIEYPLAGTPCERVIGSGTIQVVPRELGEIYPCERDFANSYFGVPIFDAEGKTVIGHMALLDDKPMSDDRLSHAVFRIFAARAGAELQRRRAEEQTRLNLQELAHAARLSSMGEMASMLAHEINQPLATILSFSQACQRKMEGTTVDGEVLHALERVVANAQRAGEIVRRMRDFVRKTPVQCGPVDMRQLIFAAGELVEPELRRHGVTLNCHNMAPPPVVAGDAIQIQQVLVNLFHNSMEALAGSSSPTRAIHVEMSCQDMHQLAVTVRDTGPGLAPHVAARLFEPFLTTKQEGLGIGLVICRSIIENHGGHLEAVPQTAGAMFRFTLPLLNPETGHEA